MNPLLAYTLFLGDSTLILSQRNSEWCGHGPILEQDIAITNISLDLLGQARNFYTYAASLKGDGSTEDSLAYMRTEREFMNPLIVELERGDWARTILRQFFFSQYQQLLFEQLKDLPDEQLAAIAEKSLKEVNYHVRWSSEWVIRLGDGTKESKQRITTAIFELYSYTGELFEPASYEVALVATGVAVDPSTLKEEWMENVKKVFDRATLELPEPIFMQKGGKQGIHTEQLGFLLAELQYLQRVYPGSEW
ncbi:MAG: phenylacetate-CoA oxygenase subunit PaaC [Chitinophagaceae bacterium]|nr:phenylacetate-CoA oxygenase subunit PaaC [Chitinophagaceae bacterium]